MEKAYPRENYLSNQAKFANNYQLKIGLALIFFGIADLWFVIPNMYAGLQGDWHIEWRFFYFYMPEWIFTIPFFLILSLIGTLMLSAYCLRNIQPESFDHKREAAILVIALGFTYQVIGAWPLWNQYYPWPWQAEIARYGNVLVFSLFIGSLVALLMGAASLYVHSKFLREN
jgi:hypothetical protein